MKKTRKPSPLTLFLTLLLSLQSLLLLHLLLLGPLSRPSPSPRPTNPNWAGDIRRAHFALNHLNLSLSLPPPPLLKIAVFSRKWPSSSSPGGMERHALSLFSSLALRGHVITVFTSGPPPGPTPPTPLNLKLIFVGPSPAHWAPSLAWPIFLEAHALDPFDVVHSESVALPAHYARTLPHVAVSWHGIAMEALQSLILQAVSEGDPLPSDLNLSLSSQPIKLIKEIGFFRDYACHVATTEAAGEMLTDFYQIPAGRVNVILTGVDDDVFGPDGVLGRAMREEMGLPDSARLVMGVAGRLVKDKGHRLLYWAFSELIKAHSDVYLVVAGSGPWAERYRGLGPQVVVLGPIGPGKLKAFYNALDVFVDPTLRPQGLDLTLMEAMQCGKPIMATRLPSIKGTLVEDEFGILFAPNVEEIKAAMETAVREGPLRLAERGRACRRYAAVVFTAKKMASAYERLFFCMKNETYCMYPLPSDELT